MKVGDNVRVITGSNKGKEGKVLKVLRSESKVLVDGINMVKKHVKPDNTNKSSGIIETEAKINASNVMIIDKKTNKPTRIYHDVDKKTNKKVRVGKSREKLD